MISKESEELPHKNILTLQFEIKPIQEDVVDDATRIIQKCIHHGNEELKCGYTNELLSGYYLKIIVLLFVQSLHDPIAQVSLKLTIKKKEEIRIDMYKFNDRAVNAIDDKSVLTDRERSSWIIFSKKNSLPELFQSFLTNN